MKSVEVFGFEESSSPGIKGTVNLLRDKTELKGKEGHEGLEKRHPNT